MIRVDNLMIGDWLLDGDSYAQVTSIACGGIIETTASNFAPEEVLQPIPLTPEILERNVFEYKDIWAEWWHRSEDGFGSDFQLSVTEDGFSMKDIANAQINSIHQLQHALRLCGLDELADNFKVLPLLAR